MAWFEKLKQKLFSLKVTLGIGGFVILTLLIALIGVGIYWSKEPALWSVASKYVKTDHPNVKAKSHFKIGEPSVQTLIDLANILLYKPGGYLSNDIMPPSIWLDNIPNWELGAIKQIRDYARVLRTEIARSQSTSIEDTSLVKAETSFRYSHNKFMFESTESQFKKAIKHVESYQARLLDENASNAQFYARADNLVAWLSEVHSGLGSYSQRLSSAVERKQYNVDLANDTAATQSTASSDQFLVKTSFWEIDDVFYEARGYVYATVQLMKASELDFQEVLIKKNALVSFKQIIRELEAALEPLGSPMVLNGDGYGVFANHSLVMANYISRANAAVIELKRLLQDG